MSECRAVIVIEPKTAIDFLLPRHYSGRSPQITKAFGLYDENGVLKAVCTFGKPASKNLCFGVCGKENSEYVYELNRLCRVDDWKEPLSYFVSCCLRMLKDMIIVSYADSGMNHNGYIYQACNFIYTGATVERTDKNTQGNKHSRHYDKKKDISLFEEIEIEDKETRKIRTSKHRYIYFCTKNKKLKKQWKDSLSYQIKPYPKNENKNYVLGEFQKQTVITKG